MDLINVREETSSQFVISIVFEHMMLEFQHGEKIILW